MSCFPVVTTGDHGLLELRGGSRPCPGKTLAPTSRKDARSTLKPNPVRLDAEKVEQIVER